MAEQEKPLKEVQNRPYEEEEPIKWEKPVWNRKKIFKPVPDREITVHLVGDDILPNFLWSSVAGVREHGNIMVAPWNTPSMQMNLRDFDGDVDSFLLETGARLGIHSTYVNSNSGARLIDSQGRRLHELGDIWGGIQDVYVVPQGWHWQWPSIKTGHSSLAPTAYVEGSPEVSLTTLSTSPKVFEIENFLSEEEVEWFLLFGQQNVLETSKLGFQNGEVVDESQRDSRSAFDGGRGIVGSPISERVTKRTFELLGMDYDPLLADAVQVVHYSEKESFKPHMDWFPRGFTNNNPVYHNGTNRYATLFIYLNDVDDGGETAFFNSTGHEQYDPANNYMEVILPTSALLRVHAATYP